MNILLYDRRPRSNNYNMFNDIGLDMNFVYGHDNVECLRNVVFTRRSNVAVAWNGTSVLNRYNLRYMNCYYTHVCRRLGLKTVHYNDQDDVYLKAIDNYFQSGFHGVDILSDFLFYRDPINSGIKVMAIGYYDKKLNLRYLDERHIKICKQFGIPYEIKPTIENCRKRGVNLLKDDNYDNCIIGFQGFAGISIFANIIFSFKHDRINAVGMVYKSHDITEKTFPKYKIVMSDGTTYLKDTHFTGYICQRTIFMYQYLGLASYKRYPFHSFRYQLHDRLRFV